jgi:hypothetical protein
VGIGTLGNGAKFLNDMRRSGAIGVTHAEINNIFAAASRSHF